MQSKSQPRGYSSSGFVALVDGRRMEFATYDEYREYVEDPPQVEIIAA